VRCAGSIRLRFVMSRKFTRTRRDAAHLAAIEYNVPFVWWEVTMAVGPASENFGGGCMTKWRGLDGGIVIGIIQSAASSFVSTISFVFEVKYVCSSGV
jgi:hypothetical protein